MTEQQASWLRAARLTMEAESEAIAAAIARLDGTLLCAVELILASSGKVVVTGIGKSGNVAQKMVGTLCSTGTPAVFLHPVEAAHGDVGIYTPGDPTILISKSGATEELLNVVPLLREFRSPLIGIIGNVTSPLAVEMDVLLDASIRREADPHNLAPTASAVVAMAIGDALAVALMEARHFTPEDFARYHPGGQIGRNMRSTVGEVMHQYPDIALASPDDSVKQVVVAMTQRPMGAACVTDPDGVLRGLITDGDLRRALRDHDDIRPLKASDIMSASPTAIGPDSRLHEALHLMEDRPSQISVLPVVDAGGKCVGLLRLHDIYHRRP